MGFKCPVCLKDFGYDKTSWDKHIVEAHYGVGKDMTNMIINICDDKSIMDKNKSSNRNKE